MCVRHDVFISGALSASGCTALVSPITSVYGTCVPHDGTLEHRGSTMLCPSGLQVAMCTHVGPPLHALGNILGGNTVFTVDTWGRAIG